MPEYTFACNQAVSLVFKTKTMLKKNDLKFSDIYKQLVCKNLFNFFIYSQIFGGIGVLTSKYWFPYHFIDEVFGIKSNPIKTEVGWAVIIFAITLVVCKTMACNYSAKR